MINYWWVSRPKRKLDTIPQVLGAFSVAAMTGRKDTWSGSQQIHIAFEDELEREGLKRVGERRDHTGSGGRTYAAWLYSLGLIFYQETTGYPFTTLAGDALIKGEPPVEILTAQVLKYQFPSSFGERVHVNPKFKVHPFVFLLRLMMDNRIGSLSEEEMAKCAIPYGFTDSKACFEDVVQRILAFRSDGDKSLPSDFIDTHQPSRGSVNLAHPYSHLLDIANTMVNWMEYTQLAARNDSGLLSILPGKDRDIKKIISAEWPFITLDSAENYQRRYGLDPDHRKDTRNLLETKSISSLQIDSQRVKSIFLAYAASKPVPEITKEACDYVAERAGVSYQTASDVLMKTYPHGAVGGFMANYYEMAFQGREHAVDFELATTNVFQDVFGYKAQHLGQTGSLSAPDVLLLSDEEDSYQAVIDCKAYSEYSISGDHHNRMVHNYVEGIDRYSPYKCRIGFFLYVSGGFGASIDKQLKEEADDCGHHGSGITVMNLIKMVQRHEKDPYSHADLERIFSVDRQVRSFDYLQYTVYVNG